MSFATSILYIAGASLVVRLLFALLGRWLAPPRPQDDHAISTSAAIDLPARPPLGNYRGEPPR